MPTDVTTSSIALDEGRSSSSRHALNALSMQAADAVEQIKGLFQAYQCIENLIMPRGAPSVELAVSDRDLYTLLVTLNEPMRRQIGEAQAACQHLLATLKQESP